MSAFLFDTCFLIDLEREMKRGEGKAHQFLRQNPNAHARLSWTVAGEFAEGFGSIDHPACEAMLSRFEMLPMERSTANSYAIITRELRDRRELIGANDLWIAAAALANDLPLVTNNQSHFKRVPGLMVVGY
ncbi:type II toxin-antitoxin system VapC family toxin [Haloferula sp.]|jgi:predicted nucleic acid-binding protein|uniref:type II toxin-antitoxin system VapC family toxin n=1 Tax=Haloferula sp. TaxID=2497595 RepID=UPI003C72AE68